MQKFFITLEGSDPAAVMIRKRSYSNGRPALELLDVEDGCPYANATVNLPDVLLAENEVLVKDYSENEGMLDFLVTNNIVYPTQRGVQSGFVWLPVCILRPENEWGSNDLESAPAHLDINTGKKMFEINGYRIWAHTYQQALELVPLIESV